MGYSGYNYSTGWPEEQSQSGGMINGIFGYCKKTLFCEEALQKVGKAANIYNAPVAVIVCADHDKAWVRPFDHKNTCDIDASILTDHMMLQATEFGLGSVWVCYFKPDVIKEEFALPDNLEPINILVIGYANENAPDEDRHEKTRIPVKQLVSYDKL